MDIKKLKQDLDQAKSIDEYWLILFDYCEENNISGATYDACFNKAKEVAATGKFNLNEYKYPNIDDGTIDDETIHQVMVTLADWGIAEGDIVSTMTVNEAIKENSMNDYEVFDSLINHYNIVDEEDEDVELRLHNSITPSNNYDSKTSSDDEILEEIWNNLETMGYSEGDIVMSDDFLGCCPDVNMDTIFMYQDEMETIYNINVLAPEVIEGDGPGNYVYIG